jgi:hypothetical protein
MPAKSTKNSTKSDKGCVGFIREGCMKGGYARMFWCEDADPADHLKDFEQYYTGSITGRYVTVENPEEVYEKFHEEYKSALCAGSDTVFSTNTVQAVADKLKEIGGVKQCHNYKGSAPKPPRSKDSDKDESEEKPKKGKSKKTEKEESEEEASEEEEEKPKKGKKKAEKEEEEEKPKKGGKKKAEKEEEEEASEEEEEKPKKGKKKPAKDESDDEGEKLKSKSKGKK